MNKDQIILYRLIEAYTTGQDSLVDAYLYDEDKIPGTLFSPNNFGLAVTDNNYTLNELLEAINEFYGTLVNEYISKNGNLLLKLKELLAVINEDKDIHSITKNVYKFILISLKLIGLDKLNVNPDESFNSKLIQSAMGCSDYTDDVLVGSPELILDRMRNFFKIIKSKDSKSIESALNEINKAILKSIDII